MAVSFGESEGVTMAISDVMALLGRVRQEKHSLALLGDAEKSALLRTMADCLEAEEAAILSANAADLAAARGSISEVMLDRLALTADRIADMAEGLRAVAQLPDPVGASLQRHTLPNGLVVEKTAVPLGLVAIIYESRPNVTADAAALCMRSGNVCVLRGGKESYRSNAAIVKALHAGLRRCGLSEDCIGLVSDLTRESAKTIMQAVGLVDLLIPRGGASLISTCVREATVPCIETGTGICHIYVDESAKPAEALSIIENAKVSRPSVCNAAEVCLVHEALAPTLLPALRQRLVLEREAAGLIPVELRLDGVAAGYITGTPAGDMDFDSEFLDYILAIKVVPDVDAAISHIASHSTGHSEAILTENTANAARFARLVDSAAVYINASTRFTDGGVFGLGCEMGISTQKLHARGPMGLRELTSYKYIIQGAGQVRS